MTFGPQVLDLDLNAETTRIAAGLKAYLRDMKRKGLVVGLSGGIDSSACAALAVKALGAARVFGVFMPEADSDPASLELGRELAAHLGIRSVVEDIAPALAGLRCYERRDAAVASVVPGFGPGWKFKIVLPGADYEGLNFYSVVARSPDGRDVRERLTLDAYLTILAATNYKQRIRTAVEYHWADRLQYAVIGTPNRLEYDQGFFVKQGDGAADIKPIVHLYKRQVYDIARHLGVPERIVSRRPTTDTYSLAQSQDEFYFNLPFEQLDLCLYGFEHGVSVDEVARATGLRTEEIERAWRDIESKRRATRYLHAPPVLVEAVDSIKAGQ
jgi:NAD+ synthase